MKNSVALPWRGRFLLFFALCVWFSSGFGVFLVYFYCPEYYLSIQRLNEPWSGISDSLTIQYLPVQQN
jgi:hypothetical protein